MLLVSGCRFRAATRSIPGAVSSHLVSSCGGPRRSWRRLGGCWGAPAASSTPPGGPWRLAKLRFMIGLLFRGDSENMQKVSEGYPKNDFWRLGGERFQCLFVALAWMQVHLSHVTWYMVPEARCFSRRLELMTLPRCILKV